MPVHKRRRVPSKVYLVSTRLFRGWPRSARVDGVLGASLPMKRLKHGFSENPRPDGRAKPLCRAYGCGAALGKLSSSPSRLRASS